MAAVATTVMGEEEEEGEITKEERSKRIYRLRLLRVLTKQLPVKVKLRIENPRMQVVVEVEEEEVEELMVEQQLVPVPAV